MFDSKKAIVKNSYTSNLIINQLLIIMQRIYLQKQKI